MKNRKKYLLAFPLVLAAILLGLSSCTKHDQVLDLTVVTPTAVLNTDTLNSVGGTATLQPIGGTAWDGTIEGVWGNAPALTVHAVVPDLGNGTFEGFVGNSTDIKMRSLHDANNIYFLVEFNTPQKNVKSAQWYYNPTTKKWAQESGVPTINPDNTTFRPPFIQDQFVILFNVANSCQTFSSLSCYAACHVNSSYGGPITPEGGAMWTNGPTEFLDCWRARTLQTENMNQANDCYIDWGNGVLNKNEVHGDLQTWNGPNPVADGGFSNKQSLTITSTTTKENVPIWIIPSGSYINSAIKLSDTLSGTAVRVIAVDSNGVLTLANSTTIDPRTGTDYKQVGAGDGPKCIPGSVVGAYTGSRGDVTCNSFYTGSGWRILMSRKLKTDDVINGVPNDVDFSPLSDLPFGVGAMFNGADNEHAIVAGLILHFK